MPCVILEDVTVDFPIYGAQKSFRTELLDLAAGGLIRREGKRRSRVTVRAIDGISLRIEHGDRLALIGHNGAGKSTLLRVLAGVFEPTGGRVTIEGRLSPLFNLSPGLDIDDTGYENVMNCGLFLGMHAREVRRKLPQIADATGLGDFLALPVRTYSAGMILRLGFAIATAIDPEILLLDEGLGAGDASFAESAERRIADLIDRSSIVVFASHALEQLRTICNKAILMEKGHIKYAGPVTDAIDVYTRSYHAAVDHAA
jgi:ABC-type polysaccharide/polyol phosphate transport system ATPase subunit